MTVGRKKELKPTAVKTWAQDNRVQTLTIGDMSPATTAQIQDEILSKNIELCVIADFSFMLPEEIITSPKYGFINIHFSLLPHYRGASPVQFTILNREKKTGITYQQMAKEMDAGKIISQSNYKLKGTETTQVLYDLLFEKAGTEISGVIDSYISNNKLTEQDPTKITYTYSPTHPKSTRIFKEDAMIDWNKTPEEIDAMVRAFDPWPIAWTTLDEISEYTGKPLSKGKDGTNTVKIFETKVSEDSLQIKTLQVAGKNKVSWKDFENGYLRG